MSTRYCGREFSPTELSKIRRLIAEQPGASRALLSRMVCEQLGWRRPGGRLKDMSCRVAMLRMQDNGLIELPAPQNGNGNGKPYRRRTPQAEPERSEVLVSAGDLVDLQLQPVADHEKSLLWNEFIDRYHYLGFQPLRGDQLRYFACAGGRTLALLGFGAAVWKTAPRDEFIGWTAEQRRRRIHLVTNNIRFLILPWIRSRNLASRILSMATRRLADDWERRYGYRPIMVETFVESRRFQGTCYKAANWIYLGETKGRGRLEFEHKARIPRKAIFVHPLTRNFRFQLCRT